MTTERRLDERISSFWYRDVNVLASQGIVSDAKQIISNIPERLKDLGIEFGEERYQQGSGLALEGFSHNPLASIYVNAMDEDRSFYMVLHVFIFGGRGEENKEFYEKLLNGVNMKEVYTDRFLLNEMIRGTHQRLIDDYLGLRDIFGFSWYASFLEQNNNLSRDQILNRVRKVYNIP